MVLRRIIYILEILMLCIFLTGCWNYRGLDEMALVSGMAIDKDFESKTYLLTFEIVDLTVSFNDRSMKSTYVQSEGRTIMEGIRNAKRRLNNKLYFGNAHIVIIGEAVAREEGIDGLIDVFLRDAEFRETLSILISQEQTASEVLRVSGTDHDIISHEIQKILHEDQEITSSTRNVQVYEIFNTLKSPGISLVLPACRNVTNLGVKTTEVNGVGVFNEDRLVGYLSPEETQPYLFMMDEIQGGILAVSLSEEENYEVSLEIFKSHTRVNTDHIKDQSKIILHIKTDVFLIEMKGEGNFLEGDLIQSVEKAAADQLSSQIKGLVKKMQNGTGSDIFGFGNKVYKNNHQYWKEISRSWDEIFKGLEIEVNSEIKIINTAFMNQS